MWIYLVGPNIYGSLVRIHAEQRTRNKKLKCRKNKEKMNSTQTNAKKSRKYQRHKVAKQLLTRSRSHKKNACVRMCASIVKRCFFFSSLSFKKKKIDDLTHFETHKYERIFFYSRAHKKLLVATFGFIAISFLALKNCDDWVIWLTSFSFQPPRNIIFYFFYILLAKKLFA